MRDETGRFVLPHRQEHWTERCFGKFPIFGRLFLWTISANRRPNQPVNIDVQTPGIMTPTVIYDCVTFSWLNYLDRRGHRNLEVDYKEHFLTVFNNVGLMAALLLTVWTSFIIDHGGSEDSDLGSYYAYLFFWVLSSTLSLLCVIVSVAYVMALNEVRCNEQLKHFMDLIDELFLGLGSILPLMLLVVSILSGIAGLYLWFFTKYGYDLPTYVAIGITIICGIVFALWNAAFVQALYTSHIADETIVSLPYEVLSIEHIQASLTDCLSSKGGIEYTSEDEFLSFLCSGGENQKALKLSAFTIELARRAFRKSFYSKIDELLKE